MVDRLFSDIRETNPNAAIMVIPQEEGYDSDDRGCASIGDATLKHVHSLSKNSAAMIMWNDIIHMNDGNMYRMVPSWEENDRDPHNMRGHDLSSLKDKFVDKYSPEVLEEIFQTEQDRRDLVGETETEDALDNEIIPYDEWEKFPGMWGKMEIASAPKNKALYMGNSSQQFYDDFPEHHPNAKQINNFLSMFNRKLEDGLTVDYAEWVVEEHINYSNMRPYVKKCLSWLVYAIASDNNRADEFAVKALRAIDKHWKIEYLNTAALKTIKNPMISLLIQKEKEWDRLDKQGIDVLGMIKRFGQLLFKKYRHKMNGYTWARYRRIKNKYAPRVLVKGVDINRCSVQDLRKVLKIEDSKAKDAWLSRPFLSLEDAYHRGYASCHSFADNENTDKLVTFIEKHTKIACESKDLARMNDVRKSLIRLETEKKGNLSSDQWRTVWKFYNICRVEVLEATKE